MSNTENKLSRNLNLLDVFCITTGAMLSSGLFLLPALAFVQAGPAVFLSYFLAGLLASAGLFSQAELATAMPKSGGTYYYVTRSMGIVVGTVYGLVTMLALSLKSAFELVSMAAFTGFFLDVDIRVVSVVLLIVFLAINFIGTKGAGRIQICLVFIIIPVLLVYLIYGFPSVNLDHFQPFASNGVMAVLSTAGFVFVSYGGLLKVASIAEEVKDPGRTLPLGMILSLIVVMLIFMLCVFVTTGLLDSVSFASSLRPVSDGAAVIFGEPGAVVLCFVAILGFASAANAGIMGASRYPLALSRDKLLPEILGRVNTRFNTPHYSILLTGIMVLASLFLNLETIIKAASSVLILTYIFSCLANIIMRESRLQNYQPRFTAPLYPWIQIAGICGFIFLLYEIGMVALYITVGFFVCGVIVYFFFGRVLLEKEHALMHLIERITAKELTSHSLETELKEVIRERDDIVTDRFDSVIENSVILDIDDELGVETFFHSVAEHLSQHLEMPSQKIYELLLTRENESSTALTSHLAIPHIIIEGQKKFDILVARCKNGVCFSDEAPDVRSVFVLMGTKDERNFHLRALAAIAQLVQTRDFEKRWMCARGVESLRDIILLGTRKRHDS